MVLARPGPCPDPGLSAPPPPAPLPPSPLRSPGAPPSGAQGNRILGCPSTLVGPSPLLASSPGASPSSRSLLPHFAISANRADLVAGRPNVTGCTDARRHRQPLQRRLLRWVACPCASPVDPRAWIPPEPGRSKSCPWLTGTRRRSMTAAPTSQRRDESGWPSGRTSATGSTGHHSGG
jgi:hypothetical protein